MKDPVASQIQVTAGWVASAKEFVRTEFPGPRNVPDWELVLLSGMRDCPGFRWWPPTPTELYAGKISNYFVLVSDPRSARDTIVFSRMLNDLECQALVRKRGSWPAEEVELTGIPSSSQVGVFQTIMEQHLGTIARDFHHTLDFQTIDSDSTSSIFTRFCQLHSYLKGDSGYTAMRQRCHDSLRSVYTTPLELGSLLSPEYKISFNFYGWQCFHALALGDWAQFVKIVRDYELYLDAKKHGKKSWAEYCAGASSDLFRSFKCWLDAREEPTEKKKQQQGEKAIQFLLSAWLRNQQYTDGPYVDQSGRGKVWFQAGHSTLKYRLSPYVMLAMVIKADLGLDPEGCEDFARFFGIYFDTFSHLAHREELVSLYAPVPVGFLQEREELFAAAYRFLEEQRRQRSLRYSM